MIAYVLGLQSYILGDNNNEPRVNNDAEINQEYSRPRFFALRVTVMVAAFFSTIYGFGLFLLTVPICWGRRAVKQMNELHTLTEIPNNDYYAILIGIFMFITAVHIVNRFVNLVTNVTFVEFFTKKIFKWLAFGFKVVISGFLLFGVIPLMLGGLFDLIILMPLRVSLQQTPIFCGWQDYAFGIVMTNVACVIRMTLDPRFKENVELASFLLFCLILLLNSLSFPDLSQRSSQHQPESDCRRSRPAEHHCPRPASLCSIRCRKQFLAPSQSQ